MANESQASRTAQYGAWERIDGRRYAATALFYRFDPQGNFVGTTKINKTIELGKDGNTFQHIARVGVYDATTISCRAWSAAPAAGGCRSSGFPTLP